MTLSEFHNALRALRFLERDELKSAGLDEITIDNFFYFPIISFLSLSDSDLAKVWPLISAQVKREQSAEAQS